MALDSLTKRFKKATGKMANYTVTAELSTKTETCTLASGATIKDKEKALIIGQAVPSMKGTGWRMSAQAPAPTTMLMVVCMKGGGEIISSMGWDG